MNVKQLIEELQKHDPEKMVVVRGYESGVDEIDTVREIRIHLNANDAWYYGKHEEEDSGECHAISLEFRGKDES